MSQNVSYFHHNYKELKTRVRSCPRTIRTIEVNNSIFAKSL